MERRFFTVILTSFIAALLISGLGFAESPASAQNSSSTQKAQSSSNATTTDKVEATVDATKKKETKYSTPPVKQIMQPIVRTKVEGGVAEKEGPPGIPKEVQARLPRKKMRGEMDKEELLQEIKDDLDAEYEILDYVPEIKIHKDKDGKEYYTFNGVNLKDLDRDRLAQLAGRISQVAVKLRTDKINQQLEVIRQAQEIANRSRQFTPVVTPPPQPPTAKEPPKSPPPPPPREPPPTRR